MAGIQNIPLRIPREWSPEWFDTFVREVLSKLDTRNSVGVGVTVTSDGNSVATLASEVDQATVDADIATAIADHEAAACGCRFCFNDSHHSKPCSLRVTPVRALTRLP